MNFSRFGLGRKPLRHGALPTRMAWPFRRLRTFLSGGILPVERRNLRDELARRGDMGTPVNCSARKKCGKTDCPAFGKIDHCWVTAGSFAVRKICPHARQGGDCRECELYGVDNEIQELNSMIEAVAISLRQPADLAIAMGRRSQPGRVDGTRALKKAGVSDCAG